MGVVENVARTASFGFLFFQFLGCANTAVEPKRYLLDGVLISTKEPALAIEVVSPFTFLGRHPVAIGEIGTGERFVFVDAENEVVGRLLIVQFEGFLPGVDDFFRYDLSGKPVVAKYPFRSNGYAFDMAESVSRNPTGEAAATSTFLKSNGYDVPRFWMMWRSLTIADEAKKKEVIIFYVEDAESIGLPLADLYRDDSPTDAWLNIQRKLEIQANSSFRLAEIDKTGRPDGSTWSSIPSTVVQ